MILLAWITLFSLCVPAATMSPESLCGSNYTRLLLMVHARANPSLTKTRLNNIVSYFITRVRDVNATSLDVCLVDPFQRKTLFDLPRVNSSRELTSAFEQHIRANVSWDDVEDFSDAKTIYDAAEYSQHFLRHVTAGGIETETKQHLIVFLSPCYGSCRLSSLLLSYVTEELPDGAGITLLTPYHNLNTKLYNQDKQKEHGTPKHTVLVVDAHDDFARFNPVPVYVCRDCPAGWKKYSKPGRNRLSCYFLDTLDAAVTWNQASNRCASIDSTLPVAETEDELMFLLKHLSLTGVVITTDLNGTETTTVVVNVGLQKNFWPKRSNYIWLNLRPFSFGADSAEINDKRQNCVALTFPVRTNTRNDGTMWTPVNCNEHNSKILVCEMEMIMVHDLTELRAQLRATARGSPRRSKFNETKRNPITFIREMHGEDWSMFDCGDVGETVTYSSVCNGARNCRNGRDEEYCNQLPAKDELGPFLCVNPNGVDDEHPTRASIPSGARCNLIQDCPDNSDELGCDGCLGRQCPDGTCVPSHWLPGGNDGCLLFAGANGTVYLNVSYPCEGHCSGSIRFNHEISFCNRNSSLRDHSEGHIFHENLTSVLKWAPKCLYLRGIGGIPTGCNDRDQLRDCSTFQCPEGFFKCPDYYCVPVYNFNDGVQDCPYGEDEGSNIDVFAYLNDMFRCNKSFVYVHQVHVCDGVQQCPRGDDETDCHAMCPPGFKCHGDAVAVRGHAQVTQIKSLSIFDIKTKFLNLSGIDLSQLKETFILPNLLEMYASHCNLVDLGGLFIPQYKSLHIYSVDFSYNNLKAINAYGPLFNLINLQSLNLSNNENMYKIELHSIWSVKLRTLDLSFTGIAVLDLNILRTPHSLRYLNLRHTKLAQIVSFQTIKRLEFLNLERTSLSPEHLATVLKSLSVRAALYVDNYKYCCPQIAGGGTPRHACHAPRDGISSCEGLLGDPLKRSLLWAVAGVSLAGNALVITYRLFHDRGVFEKGYGMFVTNLSASDFVMGVYLLIVASADAHYRDGYVLRESVWRHSAACQAAGFLSTLSGEVSTFFVLLITLDRWLVIRFPFGDHWFTISGLVLSVLSSWILGLILASVPLMHPGRIVYSSNGMCLGLPVACGRHPGWPYSFGVFICFNFILFVCIACGQMLIFRSITSDRNLRKTNPRGAARREQDINVARQLFLVALSNFLCWFPICVFGFLSGTGYEVSPDAYAWLVVFVMPLSAAVNPMIYTVPVLYSKWQDFKKGVTARPQSLHINSITAVTKF